MDFEDDIKQNKELTKADMKEALKLYESFANSISNQVNNMQELVWKLQKRTIVSLIINFLVVLYFIITLLKKVLL